MDHEHSHADRLVAQRFLLNSPDEATFAAYNVQAWHATDTVLGRELRAIVIPSDHPHRAAAIDAARRAGLFDEPLVTRTLGVVENDRESIIFTDLPSGVQLTSYATPEALDPSTLTAIIGEVTAGVNHARHRGLRHLQLCADRVYISESGAVMLDGVAWLAALAGVDTDSLSAELDRSEVRGLIVFFAALLDGLDFPEDPATHQDFVVRAAQREDLSAQIHEIFQAESYTAGIQRPSDLLRRLAPWGEVDLARVPELESYFTQQREQAEAAAAKLLAAQAEAEAAEQSGEDQEPATAEKIAWNSVFEPVSTGDMFTMFGNYDSMLASDIESAASQEPLAPPSYGVSRGDDAESDADSGATESDSAAVTAADDDSSAHSSTESTPTDIAASKILVDDDYEPNRWHLASEPVLTSGARSYALSNVVLMALSSFVGLALIIGAILLFSPLAPVNVLPPDSNDVASASAPGELPPAPEDRTASTDTAPKAGEPIAIESVAFLSANPDIKEFEAAERLFEDAPKAADGDPESNFRSWYFENPTLQASDQFGLLVKFESEAPITTISLTTGGNGGVVQWRSATEDAPLEGSTIAQSAVAPVTKLTAQSAVTAQYALIWIQQLPRDEEGQNLMRIYEITAQ